MSLAPFRRLGASLTLALLAACGGGTPTAPLPPAPPAPTPTPPPPTPAPAPAPTGSLTVTVLGLPAGQNAAITVTGPNSFSRAVTATTTLTSLATGSYTIAATGVSVSGSTWTPAPASQVASVSANTTTVDTVTYSAPPPPPAGGSADFAIQGMYLTQGVQRFDGGVPLVANKDGWLRVFVTSPAQGSAMPTVRVRLYQGGSVVQTFTVSATGTTVPATVDEGNLGQSWNVAIPANRIQPGLAILADVDPTNAVAESNESNNSFPGTGTPVPMDVRTLNTFNVRFVPVTQGGLTGDVTSANADSYLTYSRSIWPIAATTVDVRAGFTTADTANVLQSGNGNGAWGRILGEVNALRAADGSTAYYAGIVRTTYSSGVAGIGYVPGRTVLSWDRTGSRGSVLAHEFGHNFGRNHAPCGGVQGADASYPYTGGVIGHWGFDVRLANTSGIGTPNVLKPTTFTDLMGYCSNEWVSDYTFRAALDYRTSGSTTALQAGDYVQPALLVWGRVTAAGVQLEPAVELVTRASVPTGEGTHALEITDAAGVVVHRGRFTPLTVDHAEDGEAHFAFAIPLPAGARGRVAAVRVQGPQGTAELRRTAASVALDAQLNTGTPAPAALAVRGARDLRGRREARWDGAAYPFAVVRDARTGQITGFARDGVAALAGPDAELLLSDGVRTRAVRVAVP